MCKNLRNKYLRIEGRKFTLIEVFKDHNSKMKKRKRNQSRKKLSLIKLQLSKINNMTTIHSRGPFQAQLSGNDYMFPENTSPYCGPGS